MSSIKSARVADAGFSTLHAVARATERYGVVYTAALEREIVREIKRASRRKRMTRHGYPVAGFETGQKAWRVGKAADPNRQTWRVEAGGVEFQLVFNSREKVIVTFLPPRKRLADVAQ